MSASRFAPFAALACVTLAAGCTASPQPAVESPSESEVPPITTTDTSVTVAIDGIGPGFNPHLVADQTPATVAVADLVLPSMFRPAPAPDDPSHLTLQPDHSVLVSAEVITDNPFTVEYRLSDQAQWSDGAPIAVEDFQYLWQQMVTEPGVVAPAGYRQIADIRAAGGGGKTVRVVFSQPYHAWRGLFRGLVPAHLLKDLPGGFENALADGIPVSGSRFKVTTVDRGRGQILVERNDRFWGEPASPDKIVFRRAAGAAELADAVRGGDVQALDVRGGAAARSRLEKIGGVQVRRAPRARALSLTLNARSKDLRGVQVRRALLALLDPKQLALVGAGSEAAARPVSSAVSVPSDPAYRDTAPQRMSPDAAERQLREAGYVLGPPLRSEGMGAVGGLGVVIGVARGDDTGRDVAHTIADVWRSSGIDASVDEFDPDVLYSDALINGKVDAVVGWSDVDGDLATRVVSRFGCDGEAVTVGSGVRAPADGPPGAPSGTTSAGSPATSSAEPSGAGASAGTTTTVPDATPTPEAVTTVPTPPGDGDGDNFDDARRAPSNIGGVCDVRLRPVLQGALHGDVTDDELVSAVDAAVWSFATTLPILQDSGLIGHSSAIRGIMLDRARLAQGMFVDAAGWQRAR